MARLDRLPVELIHNILDDLRGNHFSNALRGYRKQPINGHLLAVACTCRALNRLVIPLLYERLVITSDQQSLLPLAYRFMKDPAIAQSVRTLSCIDVSPSEDDWPFPSDFSDVCQQWLENSCLTSWSESISERKLDYVLAVIARSCLNLTDLEVPAMFGDEFEDCSLFDGNNWPWKSLNTIHIEFGADPGGLGEDQAVLLEQLLQALSDDVSLKHLRCDNVKISGMEPLDDREPSSLNLSSIELRNAIDDVHHSDWSTPTGFVGSCKRLESFLLEVDALFIFHNRSNIETLVEDISRSLRGHNESLHRIGFDYIDYQEIWTEAIPPSAKQQLTAHDALDWKVFSNLEELFVPMPFIFGPLFFLKQPKLFAKAHYELDPPPPSFADAFRDVLVDKLPSSLQVLRIRARDIYQTRVLAHALGAMLEQRVDRFPALREIFVLVDHDEERLDDFEALLQSSAAQEARGAKVRINVSLLPPAMTQCLFDDAAEVRKKRVVQRSWDRENLMNFLEDLL